MTEFVMVHVKKETENGNWFIEDQKDIKKRKKQESEYLKGLDCKLNLNYYIVSTTFLPAVDKKAKNTQEIDEEDNDEIDEDSLKPKKKLRIYSFITDITQWKKK